MLLSRGSRNSQIKSKSIVMSSNSCANLSYSLGKANSIFCTFPIIITVINTSKYHSGRCYGQVTRHYTGFELYCFTDKLFSKIQFNPI